MASENKKISVLDMLDKLVPDTNFIKNNDNEDKSKEVILEYRSIFKNYR
ncbi:hypothetical protein [Streptococcus uberis]|nr:hypothetical protein [Streptococcus uberis]KKF47517.1 hypothetical protein AF62_09730 [Streptococcus uberis C8329]QBX12067.1 hypothetical protein JavanS631_0011 [Streptococcus satellite phage Javan631]